MESFWTEKALQQIYDMEMDEADEGRMRLGPAVNLAKSKGVVRLMAQCACHEKECRLLRAHMHAAGIPCISWSPMGRGEGVSGADFKFFVAWAATRRSVKDSKGFCMVLQVSKCAVFRLVSQQPINVIVV